MSCQHCTLFFKSQFKARTKYLLPLFKKKCYLQRCCYQSSPTCDTKPSREMKSPLWMHQSFTLWLVKTGYYHRHFFQGRAKIQRYSSSTEILSLCCHRRPESWMLLLTLQKAPGWKGQALSWGLSVWTIYASKYGHKEGNHSISCKQWMPQGLGKFLGVCSSNGGKGKPLQSLCTYPPIHMREGISVVSTEPKFSSHETVPLPLLLCPSLWGTPCTAQHRHLSTNRDHRQQQQGYSTSSRRTKVVSLLVIIFSLKQKGKKGTFSKDNESI